MLCIKSGVSAVHSVCESNDLSTGYGVQDWRRSTARRRAGYHERAERLLISWLVRIVYDHWRVYHTQPALEEALA